MKEEQIFWDLLSVCRKKGVRNGLPNHDFKQDWIILNGFLLFYELLIGLKEFATLLPNNWPAETPQTLAARRLGRQSAERERISEINWNVFQRKKLQVNLNSSNLPTV
ncbi:hypothetical protein [Peribacillus simplex]|uniref:hypothetical protein n=1 Tax=Peribacillus simplex TaxID=1478 RepID=UPI00366B17C3